MTVHLINLWSDVLLSFILFVYSYLSYVELSNCPFCFGGIRVTQKASFHFMPLLWIIQFFCICIVSTMKEIHGRAWPHAVVAFSQRRYLSLKRLSLESDNKIKGSFSNQIFHVRSLVWILFLMDGTRFEMAVPWNHFVRMVLKVKGERESI